MTQQDVKLDVVKAVLASNRNSNVPIEVLGMCDVMLEWITDVKPETGKKPGRPKKGSTPL